jgi:hypothetical protein
MYTLVARRKDKHVQSPAYESNRLVTTLPVVAPRVFCDERRAPVELECHAEGHATFRFIALALGRVERQKHDIYCTYNKSDMAVKTHHPCIERQALARGRRAKAHDVRRSSRTSKARPTSSSIAAKEFPWTA